MIIVNYKHYDDVRDRGIRYIQDTYEHNSQYIGLRTEDNMLIYSIIGRKKVSIELSVDKMKHLIREDKLKRILK